MTYDPHTDVDIAIITIRDDEFRALLLAFPNEIGRGYHRGENREYTLRSADCGNWQYRIALLRLIEQGNGEAQDAARDLLQDLQPNAALVVGVAGALPSEEVCLGDVVVATQIHDFSAEKNQFLKSPTYSATGGPITLQLASKVANLAGRQRELGDWTTHLPTPPILSLDNLSLYGDPEWRESVTRSLAIHYHHGQLAYRVPKHIDGAIASSDRFIEDPAVVRPWLTTSRKLLAVEMESGGAFRALRERCPMLTIRGIDSIIGMRRDEAWTKYACASAAAFTRAFLRTYPIPHKGTRLAPQPLQASMQTAAMTGHESPAARRPLPAPHMHYPPPFYNQQHPPTIANQLPAHPPPDAHRWHDTNTRLGTIETAPNGADHAQSQTRPAMSWGILLMVAMGIIAALVIVEKTHSDATTIDSKAATDHQPAYKNTLPITEGASAQTEKRKATSTGDSRPGPEAAVEVAERSSDVPAGVPDPPAPRTQPYKPPSKGARRQAKSAVDSSAAPAKSTDKPSPEEPSPISAKPLNPYPSTEQTPATKCARKPKKATREMGFQLDMPAPFGLRHYGEDAMEAARDRAISRAESRCQEYKTDDETVTVVIDTESYKCPSGEFGNCGFKGTGRCRFFAATEECN